MSSYKQGKLCQGQRNLLGYIRLNCCAIKNKTLVVLCQSLCRQVHTHIVLNSSNNTVKSLWSHYYLHFIVKET